MHCVHDSIHQGRLCVVVAGSSLVRAVNRQILALSQTTQQRDRTRGKDNITGIHQKVFLNKDFFQRLMTIYI